MAIPHCAMADWMVWQAKARGAGWGEGWRIPWCPCVDIRRGVGHFAGMDTMKFLLGATVALLFGAIVVSWQGMKQGVKNASPEELALVKLQIEQLKLEMAAYKAQSNGTDRSGELERVKSELLAANRKIEAMSHQQDPVADPDKDAQLRRDEEGLIAQKMLENKDSELKRARMISDALLMGRVKEFVDDATYGGFITFEILMPEQVHVGMTLGIRRGTGILGQFKVSEITPEGAIANVMPGFGPVKPEPGDQLIFPPQY